MPALVPVPKVIRYDIIQSFASNASVRDRLFFQYSGTLNAADLATLLLNARNGWNTNMAPQLNNQHTLLSIVGTDLTSASSPQAVNSTASAGTGVSAPNPAGVAMVMKFKINRRYRGGHPRFYLVGTSQADTSTPETWSAAAITAKLNAFNAFLAACVAAPPAAVATLTQVNVSYFQGFQNRTFPSGRIRPVPTARGIPLVDTVVSVSVNPKIASQRRRNQQSP